MQPENWAPIARTVFWLDVRNSEQPDSQNALTVPPCRTLRCTSTGPRQEAEGWIRQLTVGLGSALAPTVFKKNHS